MAENNFENDLKIGEAFELETADNFNRLYGGCEFIKVHGYKAEYDLICRHCNTTVECKHDYYGQHSGNFFFELKCLQKTKADWWVHKVSDNRTFIFRTKDLKDILRKWYKDGLRPVKAKNADNSEGFIVEIDLLRGVWHSINYEY